MLSMLSVISVISVLLVPSRAVRAMIALRSLRDICNMRFVLFWGVDIYHKRSLIDKSDMISP